MKKPFKVVFMGTPAFAVPALKSLQQNRYEVMLVVTQPDRPKGRGKKRIPPPVKVVATELDYDIFQPESHNLDPLTEQISVLQPDFFVVAAFGHMLSADMLKIPKKGAINIHASLLPKYRGAAPIQWAIINNEKETGITTMLMDTGMDTGDMLLSEKIEILPEDTSESLHDRLAIVGADLLIRTLENFDSISPMPQNHDEATYAPMLSKKDGRIVWEKPAKDLEAFIRGVTPWPGAFTFHKEKRLKIFKAMPVSDNTGEAPGTVIKGFPDELRIATGEDALSVLEIQGSSGKRLSITDFLRGYDISPGELFT